MNGFDRKVYEHEGAEGLFSKDIQTIQVNVGLKCNLQCRHCHVASSPLRTETMSWDVMKHVINLSSQHPHATIDITGGAPELHPHIRDFIRALKAHDAKVMLRTNLTVLLMKEQADLPEFFKTHQVQLIASLPCYLEENVNKQRGNGVYNKSIQVIRQLNGLGYGVDPQLALHLVYNPLGPNLPPSQGGLENDYRKELKERFGIVFTGLYTLTNMPIGRFMEDLMEQKQAAAYMKVLMEAFNAETLSGLMCRHQVNIGWDGRLYDCDFNYALNLPVQDGGANTIQSLNSDTFHRRRVVTGAHCFGCTAGCGSSCGGALA